VRERGGTAGDEGRTKTAGTVRAAHLRDAADVGTRQRLGVEADAVAAVHLDVEPRRGDPPGFQIGGRGSRWADRRDAATVNRDLNRLLGGVVAGADEHEFVRGER
jgi:hypothetical protein